MKIEPMLPEHIDLLMSYEREMFGHEAWTASSYRTELADTKRRYYVVALGDDGGLLGWGGVMVVADTAEILTVGSVPSARRRGIGTALVGELVAAAQHRGATEMFLEVRVGNDAAIMLYEREGFTAIGTRRGYYENGRVDALVMRRKLHGLMT